MTMFDGRVVNDDGSEDCGSMYLNAAGIDDDMNGLMNCHRLDDISTSDVCNGLETKHEYVEEENVDETADVVVEHAMDVVGDDHESGDVSPSASIPHGITAITMTRRRGRTYKTIRHMKVDLSDDNHDDDGDDLDDLDDGVIVDNDLDDLDEEEIEDEEEEDEGRPVSLEVRQLYISASNERGMQQETMCDICATVFKTRYNLLRHYQKRHPEFKMYECDLCRISYPSIDEFKDHLDEKHSKMHTSPTPETKQVRFACDVCGNMYKNKASAMNHLLTHTAKKTVRCKQCDFKCYTKQQLGVHQTKHDKRFVCDICHKRFAQKSQLDVHVKAVHYNQRPFSCVLCKKTFKTKGSHDAHMVVHTDTRNYQCPHCDKKCRKRYDLTLHIRTHTGEKPFKCSVCGRGFVQMCDTRKHEMLHFKPGRRKNLLYSSPDAGTGMDDE